MYTTLYVYHTKVHTTMKYSSYELLFEVISKEINFSKLIEQLLKKEHFTLLNYKQDFTHQTLVKKQAKQ